MSIKEEVNQPIGQNIEEHDHAEGFSTRYTVIALTVALVLALLGIYWDHTGFGWWGSAWLRTTWYLLAYIPVAIPVIKGAIELLVHEKSFFNEYTLMTIASIGALYIGEYPESVMLMILYTLGEILQDRAVDRARENISKLIDMRPESVTRVRDGVEESIHPSESMIGDTLRMLPGDRVSLDGVLLSSGAVLDMSALTGESRPVELGEGDNVLAGSIVQSHPIDLRVSKAYSESTLAKILEMVEQSSERKPETEKFIRRFSRVYTPIIFGLSLLLIVLPWVWSLVSDSFLYDFETWLYRGMVFLVTACPCALIISVPLGFLGGVGAASRKGILFKGAVYLDKLRKVDMVVTDKTGTMTYGTFDVTQESFLENDKVDQRDARKLLLAMEASSTHPIAQSVVKYLEKEVGDERVSVKDISEVAGMGVTGIDDRGRSLAVGNVRLMQREGVSGLENLRETTDTQVLLAVDGTLVLVIELGDHPKPTSADMVQGLKSRGVKQVIMLSGDRKETVEKVSKELGMTESYGGLLPQDKIHHVEQWVDKEGHLVAFIGDGLNDAPVMAMSEIGIAMGGIGSEATIEAADVVIQSDDPYKVVQGIDISRFTYRIVVGNIIFALAFKMIVLVLAALGIATLTMAVIADVGVSLVAVLNCLRVLKYKPSEP